ncbi:MAG: hypothetical protein H0V44_06300 [Planctomycetes bacterium]|nr:hypothetical protein [Planctomycetota bacterium]
MNQTRSALRALLVVAWLGCAFAAEEDAYAPWMQGRPHDAIAGLQRAARSGGGWGAWFDCALAARAAGDNGRAQACLLEAHRLAPARAEPLAALRLGGATIAPTWCERAGPIAWAGSGWPGVAMLAIAGACLGWWCCSRRRRNAIATLGAILVTACAPGAIAVWLDAHAPLIAVVRDTHLVDSTGAATSPVEAGTVLTREGQRVWNGRVLVQAPDGARGFVSLADTRMED